MVRLKPSSILKAAAAILLCLLAGAAGSYFTAPAIPGWYAFLDKPGFTPPRWVFAPVWTTLYILMGIALYRVWSAGSEQAAVRKAMLMFLAQLLANVAWSAAFFGMRSPEAGIVVIVLLWVSLARTEVMFYRISRPAGLLIIPVLAWVSYAAALNVAVAGMNP